MAIVTEQKEQETESCVENPCFACHDEKEEIILSCASIYCPNKIHIDCAVRPEGSQLHFCSRKCVDSYFTV